MTEPRIEKDTFGEIAVPGDRLWGAQTERSLHHFDISTEKMPPELIRALALVKRGAAVVNRELGTLAATKADAIVAAADEVLAGRHDRDIMELGNLIQNCSKSVIRVRYLVKAISRRSVLQLLQQGG